MTPQALLEHHLRTRYGPSRDDAAHLATFHPDAFVVAGDRHARAREAGAVLAAWSAVGGQASPRFGRPSDLTWHEAGPDRGVLTASLYEETTNETLSASFGLERHEDAWRIAWGAVSESLPTAVDWEPLRLTALSELSGIRYATAESPLTSLLEVSWSRQRRLPKQRLLALPETAFSCVGTGSCCSHELTIGLDDASVAFIEAVDWPAVAPGLPEGPYVEALPQQAQGMLSFNHRLARDARGRCRFLTDDRRCSIHALAGRAVFKPCHVFPYRFTWSPDGICVTTNAMCPTARKGLGQPMAVQEPELRRRLAVADVARAEKFYLSPGEEVPWEVFRTVEGQLLELLSGEAPMKQKLWVAIRWLEARRRDPLAGVDPRWAEEAPGRLGLLQRMVFQRFAALFDRCFGDLKGVEAGEGALPDHEAELTAFFRSLLFSKATTYPYGLVAGLNYMALTYLVLERQLARHARRGISEAFWREFYAVVTSGLYLRLLTVYHQTPQTQFARHAGDPAFGLSLLRVED
ncbi:MAG: YkgJ family cysteine cluster protein [Candidatus Sericytochromatia bacterium]